MTSRTPAAGGKRFQQTPGLPLHVQVEQRIRELADDAAHRRGVLLPDEVALAGRFGVSRGTVRAAMARLVQAGVLERRAGVGTRVARPRPESGIGAWRSFSREMARQGVTVETLHQVVAFAVAPQSVSRALGVPDRSRLLRLDRVRGWNARPVLHSRSWFHPRLKLTGREDFDRPLYDVIESVSGVVADAAHEAFSAVLASAALARQLRVAPGAPLLLRSHTVRDRGGRPFEHAEVHYCSDRFTLSLDLKRGDA
jgi:GntR family transcriptional regulator